MEKQPLSQGTGGKCRWFFSSLTTLYSKQRYGHRSTSLTPI